MIYPNKFRIITSLSELTNQDEGLFYYMPDTNPPKVIEQMSIAIKDMLDQKPKVPAGMIEEVVKHQTIFQEGTFQEGTREERENYFQAHVNSLRYIAGVLVAWGQNVRMHDERINKVMDVAVLINAFEAFVNEAVPYTNTNKILEEMKEARYLYDFHLITSGNLLSLSIKNLALSDLALSEYTSWKITKPQAILWVEYLKYLFIDDWIPPGKVEFLTTEDMRI